MNEIDMESFPTEIRFCNQIRESPLVTNLMNAVNVSEVLVTILNICYKSFHMWEKPYEYHSGGDVCRQQSPPISHLRIHMR